MSRKHIAIPSVRSVDKTVMDQKTATYLDRQVRTIRFLESIDHFRREHFVEKYRIKHSFSPVARLQKQTFLSHLCYFPILLLIIIAVFKRIIP